jgi:hypothetical protein
MWLADRRHGVGTLRSTAGAIFVGSFEHDRRQGLGVTFWGSRCALAPLGLCSPHGEASHTPTERNAACQRAAHLSTHRCRRYVAEYVDDAPTCGTMTALGDADDDEAGAMSAVPAGQLRQAIAAARIQAAAAAAAAAAAGAVAAAVDAVSCPPPQMPRLGLAQPSKVRGVCACGGATCSPSGVSTPTRVQAPDCLLPLDVRMPTGARSRVCSGSLAARAAVRQRRGGGGSSVW